jgi:competence protein ComEC
LIFLSIRRWHEVRSSAPVPQPFVALVFAALALVGPLFLTDAVPRAASIVAVAPLLLALPRSLRRFGVALVCMQVARASLAADRGGAEARALRERFLEPQGCRLVGTVTGAVTAREGLFGWEIEVARAECDRTGQGSIDPGARARVRFRAGDFRRGDSLALEGLVSASRGTAAPWELAPRLREAREEPVLHLRAEGVRVIDRGRGPLAPVDEARARLRRFFSAHLEDASARLVRALVLAEIDLEPGTASAFKRSGLAHVLAVSGMHLALVAGGVAAVARALLRRAAWLSARVPSQSLATVPAAIVAVAYAGLTGFGGSSMRALTMLAAHAVFVLAGRRPSGASSLAASSLAVAAIDPLALADLSTSLSLAATAALVLFGGAVSARIPGPRPAAAAIGASLAATAGTAPVLTAFALPVPLAGLVANLPAVPLGELVALPFALVGALFALCNGRPAELLATACLAVAAAGLTLVARVAALAASLPSLVVFVPQPSPLTASVLLVGASLAAALRHARARRQITLAAALAALASEGATRRALPRDTLRVTHLDVGQGDSAVIEFPGGPVWLVDGGGLIASPIDVGERVVVPALVNARRRPDVVVLSHPHPDHFGGLAAVLRDQPPRELWDTGQGEHEGYGGGYAALLDAARRQGVVVRNPSELCGPRRVGDAFVEVLAPCPGPTSDRGPNDNSFVFRVRFGARSILFTGDAERELEEELLSRIGVDGLRSDVLKVAHHGSRTSSTPAFLEAVTPSIAIVSAGVRNRFGHPHPKTLAALGARGIAVRRTDLLGTLREETDGLRWSEAPPPFSAFPFAAAW